MEIIGIVDILNLCWVHGVLQLSVVLFIESRLLFSIVLLKRCLHSSLFEFSINRFSRRFCETFAIQVFRCNLGDEAGIAWDMLRFEVVGRASDPGLASFGVVSEFLSFTIKVMSGFV